MATKDPARTDTTDENDPKCKVMMKGAQVLGYYGARKQRTSLSIQTKLEVIKFAEENPSVTQNKIASHFGIDRTTVSKVLKRKDMYKTTSIDDIKSESCSSTESQNIPNTNFDTKHIESNALQVQVPIRKSNRAPRPKGSPAFQYQHSPENRFGSWTSHHQRNMELYEKCESWFMKQKFTTASKKHQKDIIAYSCLISPLPLSIEDCDKIIPAKLVMDESIQWLYEQIRNSDTRQPGMESLEGRGEELLLKYIQEEGPTLKEKLESVFKSYEFDTDALRRVWKKYVGPKFMLFGSDGNSDGEMNGQMITVPSKKTKTSGNHDSNQHLIPILPANTLLTSSNAFAKQMFLVPTSKTSGHNIVQIAPSTTTSVTSHLPDVPVLPVPLMTSAKNQPLLASALGLTNGHDNGALDLSNPNVERGLDLSQRSESIRGSRKRKMNSNPVRIITQQKDDPEMTKENGDCHDNSDNENPELVRCLEFESHTIQKSPKSSNNASEETPGRGLTEHPIIEIIPDSCRSNNSALRENNTNMPKHQNAAMNFCSKADQMKTAGINCDNNESLHDLSNNNRSLSLATVKGIIRNMSLIAKEVKNLKAQVEHSKSSEIQTGQKCKCDCSSKLDSRISKLEENFESMQEKLDKLYETVINK